MIPFQFCKQRKRTVCIAHLRMKKPKSKNYLNFVCDQMLYALIIFARIVGTNLGTILQKNIIMHLEPAALSPGGDAQMDYDRPQLRRLV